MPRAEARHREGIAPETVEGVPRQTQLLSERSAMWRREENDQLADEKLELRPGIRRRAEYQLVE